MVAVSGSDSGSSVELINGQLGAENISTGTDAQGRNYTWMSDGMGYCVSTLCAVGVIGLFYWGLYEIGVFDDAGDPNAPIYP